MSRPAISVKYTDYVSGLVHDRNMTIGSVTAVHAKITSATSVLTNSWSGKGIIVRCLSSTVNSETVAPNGIYNVTNYSNASTGGYKTVLTRIDDDKS